MRKKIAFPLKEKEKKKSEDKEAAEESRKKAMERMASRKKIK